ncbi:hypothetical protein ACFL2H_05910 [Planctomycetota bacterium]
MSFAAEGGEGTQDAPESRLETAIADCKLKIYRVMPLYPEEWELQAAEGIPALMNAFDKAGVRQIVSRHRPNVAGGYGENG